MTQTTPVVRRTIQRLSGVALRAAHEQAQSAISDTPSEYWMNRLQEIQIEMKTRPR